MRIFLTGSESFIGAVLWDMLERAGHEVTGMDVAPPRRAGAFQMDLRDSGLAERIPEGATIIHLAAVSTDALCKANPLEALDVNLTGTLRLAQAAARRKCEQFVFASTEWVYGDVPRGESQTEELPIDVARMTSVYAFSKVAGERMLVLSGLENVTILRFGIVYGPREQNWSAVESLLEKVRCGKTVQIGSLESARRFIHVRDLCNGVLASLGQERHQCFNLPGERLITLSEVLETSQRILDRRLTVTETAPGNSSVRNPDGARARKELGWTPRISFDDGMAELAKFLQERATYA